MTSDPSLVLKVSQTCDALETVGVKYNYTDRAFYWMSNFINFEDPKFVYDIRSMHSAQCVVLTLRTCLPSDHLIHSRLAAMNSRTTTPSDLVNALRDLSQSVLISFFTG